MLIRETVSNITNCPAVYRTPAEMIMAWDNNDMIRQAVAMLTGGLVAKLAVEISAGMILNLDVVA